MRRLRIRSKLLLAVGLPLIVLVPLAVLGADTLLETKVGGPLYAEIVDSEQLLRDTSVSPPLSVEPAYITLIDFASAVISGKPERAEDAEQKVAESESRFRVAQEYWIDRLTARGKHDPEAAGAADALRRSSKTADKFFKLLNGPLSEAARNGDVAVLADMIPNELFPLVDQYRDETTIVRQLARGDKIAAETMAQKVVDDRSTWLLIVLVITGVIALLLGAILVRGISRPIMRITRSARHIAEDDLPRAVSAIQQGEESPSITRPPNMKGKDEVAQLGRAVGKLQSTSIDLATKQARMQRNTRDLFVSLGRRNQGLLSRTLAFITELERDERDPERLQDLFRVDHLATRMRRNAESLLVLAGEKPARTWSEAVSIDEVVRAALSEIEAYTRVDYSGLAAARLRGSGAADVAHLLAELLENATSYSSPSTAVVVFGTPNVDGYVLTIVDQGVGMSDEQLEEANEQFNRARTLDDVPTVQLGLYVVGRLAARHGIRVRLDRGPAGGVVAVCQLPADLVEDTFGGGEHPDAPHVTPIVAAAPDLRVAEPDVLMPEPPGPENGERVWRDVPAMRPTVTATAQTATGLTRRTRGASAQIDTTEDLFHPGEVTPEQVRIQLGRLQSAIDREELLTADVDANTNGYGDELPGDGE